MTSEDLLTWCGLVWELEKNRINNVEHAEVNQSCWKEVVRAFFHFVTLQINKLKQRCSFSTLKL